MKFTTLDHIVRRSVVGIFVVMLVVAAAGLVRPPHHAEPTLVAARKPLVVVAGQTEQIVDTDYLTVPGGATLNGTASSGAGDIELTQINQSGGSLAMGGAHVRVSGSTGQIDTDGPLGVGTGSPGGEATIVTANATAGVSPSVWNNQWVTIGPATGTTGSALGIGFNSSASVGAILTSIAPSAAFRAMTFQALQYAWDISGGASMSMDSSGNLSLAQGSIGINNGSLDVKLVGLIEGALSAGPTLTRQKMDAATVPTGVTHGTLSGDASNFVGTIAAIGANTSTTLTLGGGGFTTSSHCHAQPNSGSYTTPGYQIIVTQSNTAPVFSCFTVSTGVTPGNCPDIDYLCTGH